MRKALPKLDAYSRYTEFRRRLDARAVLDHYGIENERDEQGKDDTTEVIHSCLLDRVEPHHNNGDQNPSACLAGDTTIHLIQGKKGQWPLKRTIAEIYQLWHEGIPHHYREGKAYRQTPQGNWATCVTWRGEKHYLGTFPTENEAAATVEKFRDEHPYDGRRKYSRNVRVRSWDVTGDRYGRIGTVSDVWQTGVKPLLEITTESGKTLRCTAEHRVYSGDGWVTAGEIRAGQDWLFREGRGRDYTKPKSGVPEYLRKAIGVWTQSQRAGIIMPVDCCYRCGQRFLFEELELDHVVSVVQDLTSALDVTNLSPICKECHRSKSNLENGINPRPGTKLKALPDRVVGVRTAGSEMTYDMEVPDWRNYTANGLVVHNSCNLEKKLYVCHAYWGGDLFHLIQKMENKNSFEDIVPFLSGFLEGSQVEPDRFADELEKLLAAPGGYSIELPSYADRVLAPWAVVHPYLHERGVDSDTASRLQVGWRENDNRITIPHFWEGKLVGWQARAVPDRPGLWPGTADPMPKYRSTPGFPKSTTLYYNHSRPFPRPGSTVVVVESPFSVIKAVALGLDIPVLATFGAKVSTLQTTMLADFGEVILWPDPDAAGRVMEQVVVQRLRHPGLRIVTPDPGKDLADYDSLSKVVQKIDDAEPALLKSLG